MVIYLVPHMRYLDQILKQCSCCEVSRHTQLRCSENLHTEICITIKISNKEQQHNIQNVLVLKHKCPLLLCVQTRSSSGYCLSGFSTDKPPRTKQNLSDPQWKVLPEWQREEQCEYGKYNLVTAHSALVFGTHTSTSVSNSSAETAETCREVLRSTVSTW